jgi:hypothetical protein
MNLLAFSVAFSVDSPSAKGGSLAAQVTHQGFRSALYRDAAAWVHGLTSKAPAQARLRSALLASALAPIHLPGAARRRARLCKCRCSRPRTCRPSAYFEKCRLMRIRVVRLPEVVILPLTHTETMQGHVEARVAEHLGDVPGCRVSSSGGATTEQL